MLSWVANKAPRTTKDFDKMFLSICVFSSSSDPVDSVYFLRVLEGADVPMAEGAVLEAGPALCDAVDLP